MYICNIDSINIIYYQSTDKDKHLTVDEITAQVMIFFIGGFYTSATVVSQILFELAKNKDIQKKMHIEMDEMLKKHNNELTYECIHDMKYLSQVLEEGLRKYPSVPVIVREVQKDYKIPNNGAILEKGIQVFVNVQAMHRDPEYFPNPLEFNPDRFSPEYRADIKPYTYIPFGEGPRNCIGSRFGQLQSKLALVSVLSKYNVELASGMEDEIQYQNIAITAKEGINLLISKRT